MASATSEEPVNLAVQQAALADLANYRITDIGGGLFIGNNESAGYFGPGERTREHVEYCRQMLAANDIRAIVSCTRLKPVFPTREIAYVQFPLTDADSDENYALLRDELPRILDFIDQKVRPSGRAQRCSVLVHCNDGTSASPTVVIAYFMRTYPTMSFREVYEHVARLRPVIRPKHWRYLRDVLEPMFHRKPVDVEAKMTELFGTKVRDYEDGSLKDKDRTLKACLGEFLQANGQVFTGTIQDVRVDIQAGDTVYPVCTQGINRSQVIYLLVNRIKNTIGCKVEAPHGAGNGNDPYVGYNPRDVAEAMSYIRDMFDFRDTSDPMNVAFHQVFQQQKNRRVNDSAFEENDMGYRVNNFDDLRDLSNTRNQLRIQFSQKYFALVPTSGRRIFIAFNRATHILMARLLECGVPVDKTIIYGIDYPDPVNTAPSLVEAYQNMERDLKQILPDDMAKLSQERDAAVAERNAAVAERNAAVAERNAAVAEREAARTALDQAQTQTHNLDAKLRDIASDRDIAIQGLHATTKALEEAKADASSLQQDNKRLLEQLRATEEELRKSSETTLSLQEQLSEAKAKAEGLELKLHEAAQAYVQPESRAVEAARRELQRQLDAERARHSLAEASLRQELDTALAHSQRHGLSDLHSRDSYDARRAASSAPVPPVLGLGDDFDPARPDPSRRAPPLTPTLAGTTTSSVGRTASTGGSSDGAYRSASAQRRSAPSSDVSYDTSIAHGHSGLSRGQHNRNSMYNTPTTGSAGVGPHITRPAAGPPMRSLSRDRSGAPAIVGSGGGMGQVTRPGVPGGRSGSRDRSGYQPSAGPLASAPVHGHTRHGQPNDQAAAGGATKAIYSSPKRDV